ncbi:hypothetical protein GCK32_018134 [Trichostrongylus colubriformis]|uniref:Uncharacterized protein n=1 Tax=Trichostrongylus colubriformis TaxID=6319 RepID=A0AAN8J2G7_TRICO
MERTIVYGYTEDSIMLLTLKIYQSDSYFGSGGYESILIPHLQLLGTVNRSIWEPSDRVLIIEPSSLVQNK